MTLYFAYGSNMSRALMHRLCPHARPLGIAVLDDHRFIITVDGYASVVIDPRACVHGVLWRVGPREITALNAYESVDTGLYRRRILPVRHAGERASALVYVGRSCRHGQPKPGYMELVLAGARDWTLPAAYVATLARWDRVDCATTSSTGAGEIA
jgi:gamma-glutamylcyclotransferase (GGCT)/AIG2-like uncharacterized protein YtfP